MSPNWSLREELQLAALRWPIIILFILVGSLVGWFFSRLYPSPFHASSELYVGLDVYRALKDRNLPVRPETVNDYKNWQMDNLETLLLSQAIVHETLVELRKNDPYWNDIKAPQLAEMLKVNWRNAGSWFLVAEHPDPTFASQITSIWEKHALKAVHTAVEKSQQVLVLDARIQATAAELASIETRKVAFEEMANNLETWQNSLSTQPEQDSLEETIYIQGLSITPPLDLESNWKQVIETFPESGSTVDKYQTWSGIFEAVLHEELKTIDSQIQTQQQTLSDLEKRYGTTTKTSYGISANLIVESVTNATPEVHQIRTTSALILVGGFLGGVTWMAYWLASISMKRRE